MSQHLTPNALDLARSRSIADVAGIRRVAEIWRAKGDAELTRFYDESAEIADALAELARRQLVAKPTQRFSR